MKIKIPLVIIFCISFFQYSFAQWIEGLDGANSMVTTDRIGIGGMPFPAINSKLHVDGGQDAALSCRDCGYLIIGDIASTNISIDNNEIMARQGNAPGQPASPSDLGLQADGGTITIHGGSGLTEDKKIRIAENGNMGIGTLSPTSKLHVNGAALIAGPESDGSTTGTLKLVTGTHTMTLDGNEIDGPGDNTLHINWNVGGKVVVGKNGDVILGAEAGKVGIGTGNIPSGYKLAVNGKIISTEVRVQTQGSWPDYVFEEDYDLLPLPELEQSIRENGKLPGMPSAKEVEAEGIELGEMDRRLLEKIEELTLYVIELQKQNEALQQRIENLEKQ